MNEALNIIARAAEIRQESAPGANLVPFEETTTAQKVRPIGQAWAEYHGWRPSARILAVAKEAVECGIESVIRDSDGTVMERWADEVSDTGKAWVVVGCDANSARVQPTLPATVLWESGGSK